jgi:AcrR family transcriptional regulator
MTPGSADPPRIGRPKSQTADSHGAIMDAVHALLRETSVRDLTMEAVAKRAGVGKPTLYKWWPSKAALVFAMFHERLADDDLGPPQAETAEGVLRAKVRRLIGELGGQFGKVMAELIAEGQSDPDVLRELYEQHIGVRRAAAIADVERGKASGELRADVDSELLIEEIIAPLFFRMLLRHAPLSEAYGDALIDQALRGLRTDQGVDVRPGL